MAAPPANQPHSAAPIKSTGQERDVKLCRMAAAAILFASAVIMAVNSFTHPVKMTYDYWEHLFALRYCSYWNFSSFYPLTIPNALEYNPPLYYHLGRIHYLIAGIFGDYDPYYTTRILHIFSIMIIAGALIYKYLSRYYPLQPGLKITLALCFSAVPGLYLFQVNVRADHLLFFSSALLFCLWFFRDWSVRLRSSPKARLLWFLLLATIMNSRHFGIVAYGVFLAMGLMALFFVPKTQKDWARLGRLLVFLAALAILSFHIYGFRYYLSKKAVGMFAKPTPFHAMLQEKAKTFDRRILFCNLEFNKLFVSPNRYAPFSNENALWPRLYGDIWGDHWLWFSGPVELVERKAFSKQVIFLLAAPLTVAIVLGCLASFVSFGAAVVRRLQWQPHHVAAAISVGCMMLYMYYLYTEPMPGNNSNVKGAYIYGYFWCPLVCFIHWLSRFPRLIVPMNTYLFILFIFALPLAIYRFGL